MEASPGLPIGVGGKPVCLRRLYGLSRLSSDWRSGLLQLPVA